jgi:ribonuclease P protein component
MKQTRPVLKLANQAQFEQVMASELLVRSPHFVVHMAKIGNDASENNANFIGLIVPKKWAKKAVARNAIKRQVIETWRQWVCDKPAMAYVVRLKSSWKINQFKSAVSNQFKESLRLELSHLFATIRYQ